MCCEVNSCKNFIFVIKGMIFVDFFLCSCCRCVFQLLGCVAKFFFIFVTFIVTRYVACYVQCYSRPISKRWLIEAVLTMNYFFRCFNIYPTRCNVTQFILSGNCSTSIGWYHHTSSGAQTTISTASGICHTFTATCRYSGRQQVVPPETCRSVSR